MVNLSVVVIKKTIMDSQSINHTDDLDGKEINLILVRCTKCAQVPVKDDSAAIEADTNLTRSDALVSDIEGDTLFEVAARLRDGDRSQDGNVNLGHDLDAKVYEVIVYYNLLDNYRQNNAQIVRRRRLTSRGPIEIR